MLLATKEIAPVAFQPVKHWQPMPHDSQLFVALKPSFVSFSLQSHAPSSESVSVNMNG